MPDDFSWLYQSQPKALENAPYGKGGEHSSTNPQKDNFEWLYNNPSKDDQVTTTGSSFGEKLYGAAQSTGVGAAKGAANLADFFFGPTFSGAESMFTPQERSFEEGANRNLPQPQNQAIANTAEGAVSGAPMGPAGMIIGGATAGGTELMNQYNPGHPIANTLIPMGAGMVAPGLARNVARAGRLMGEGTGLINRTPEVQARLDQDIRAGTPVSVSDDDFWFKLQRGVRESILGSPINRANEAEVGQLEGAVNRQADLLGPPTTNQQIGIKPTLADGVGLAKKAIRDEREQLDQFVDPKTTHVDMTPVILKSIDQLGSEPGAHISLTGNQIHTGDQMIDRLMNNVIDYNKGGSLSLSAIRSLKQEVGDRLEESLLNGDASKRQLKQMYGILSDAEEQAYSGPIKDYFTRIKAAEHEMYSDIENFVEPLLKEGLSPEKVANSLSSEMKFGGTKLQKAFELIDTANPNMRNQYSSMVLRNLGQNNKGEFDPNRFFTNWQKISPEAKQQLFGQGNQDLPKAYDQLATLAQGIGRSSGAINRSGTAGTEEILQIMRLIGGVAGGAIGVGADKYAHDQGDVTERGVSGLGGALPGALIASTLGNRAIAKLMVNPAFVRWIATPVPFDNIPTHLKALSAVAGEAPELKKELAYFQDQAARKDFENLKYRNDPFSFFKGNTQGSTDNTAQPFAKGGYVKEDYVGGGYAGWPEQTPTGYALGGLTDTVQPNQKPEETEKAGKIPTLENAIPASNTDPRYFSQVKPQGYVGGGVASSPFGIGFGGNEMMGYAEGGPAKSILDMTLAEKMQRIQQLTSDRMASDRGERAAGSPARSFSSIANDQSKGYSQGGVAHDINDPRPFYNPQLPNVVSGGWADGGPVSGSQIGEYANGGPSLSARLSQNPVTDWEIPSNASILDRAFPGWRDQGEDENVPWNERIVHGKNNPEIDIESEIKPRERFTDPFLSNSRAAFPDQQRQQNEDVNGPVYPRQSFEDAINDKVTSYAQGGSVDNKDSILNLIMKYESAGRNVMNYINDKTHTAGGYFQITNTTWRNFAPAEIKAKYPSAISAPYDVQRAVAERILESPGGIHHWSNYNPKLASALGQGEVARDTHTTIIASNGSILDHFLGEGDNTTNLADREEPQEGATDQQEPEVSTKQALANQALERYSFAEPLTKLGIKGIWENANV